MRTISLSEALALYRRVMAQSGGLAGIRDLSALHSALVQAEMTFDGQDLYSTLIDKAAAIGFSLISNHPFLDGNKRIGHAVMEAFLLLNGWEIRASTDEQEEAILRVASGEWGRDQLTEWLRDHVIEWTGA